MLGAIAEYFHKIVTNPTIAGWHDRAAGLLERFGGKAARHVARKAEEAAKGLIGPGMLFEEFGLSYYGPLDGTQSAAADRDFQVFENAEQAGPTARDYAEGTRI